jgi:N-ethylmaleimide reductase
MYYVFEHISALYCPFPTSVFSMNTLFSPFTLGKLSLKSRIVMGPMTRNRNTPEHTPTPLMVQYYAERATAGLIITEGTAPSPNGLGYARIPGIFSAEQIAAWKTITDAVHAKGGKIFCQIMHTGRVSHLDNMPKGAEVVAPSAIGLATSKLYVDGKGELPAPTPRALTTAEVSAVIGEFAHAAKAAIEAGFDGVELHGANGYLIEQFLNPASNHRTDEYGGSAVNRNRFAVEVAKAVSLAIGTDRVGIRVSPYGVFNEMESGYAGEDSQYESLASELKVAGISYIHVVDHSSMGAPAVPQSVKDAIRKAFGGTIILSGGYDATRAEADLVAGKGELVSFSRPFIANPDFPERIAKGIALAQPDFATFYTPGEKGYTDYPKAT